jgi:hypothetical protein
MVGYQYARRSRSDDVRQLIESIVPRRAAILDAQMKLEMPVPAPRQ